MSNVYDTHLQSTLRDLDAQHNDFLSEAHSRETGLEDDMNALALTPYNSSGDYRDEAYASNDYLHDYSNDLYGRSAYDDHDQERVYEYDYDQKGYTLYPEQDGIYDHYHIGGHCTTQTYPSLKGYTEDLGQEYEYEDQLAEGHLTQGLNDLDGHYYSDADLERSYADGQYQGYLEGGYDGFQAGENIGNLHGELTARYEGLEEDVFDTLGAMDGYDFYGFGAEALTSLDFYTPSDNLLETTAVGIGGAAIGAGLGYGASRIGHRHSQSEYVPDLASRGVVYDAASHGPGGIYETTTLHSYHADPTIHHVDIHPTSLVSGYRSGLDGMSGSLSIDGGYMGLGSSSYSRYYDPRYMTTLSSTVGYGSNNQGRWGYGYGAGYSGGYGSLGGMGFDPTFFGLGQQQHDDFYAIQDLRMYEDALRLDSSLDEAERSRRWRERLEWEELDEAQRRTRWQSMAEDTRYRLGLGNEGFWGSRFKGRPNHHFSYAQRHPELLSAGAAIMNLYGGYRSPGFSGLTQTSLNSLYGRGGLYTSGTGHYTLTNGLRSRYAPILRQMASVGRGLVRPPVRGFGANPPPMARPSVSMAGLRPSVPIPQRLGPLPVSRGPLPMSVLSTRPMVRPLPPLRGRPLVGRRPPVAGGPVLPGMARGAGGMPLGVDPRPTLPRPLPSGSMPLPRVPLPAGSLGARQLGPLDTSLPTQRGGKGTAGGSVRLSMTGIRSSMGSRGADMHAGTSFGMGASSGMMGRPRLQSTVGPPARMGGPPGRLRGILRPGGSSGLTGVPLNPNSSMGRSGLGALPTLTVMRGMASRPLGSAPRQGIPSSVMRPGGELQIANGLKPVGAGAIARPRSAI